MPEQHENKNWEVALQRIEKARRSNAPDLDLENLNLTAIPESLGQLKNLSYLSIFANQVTDIPQSIGQLINLHLLDLSANHLTAIPAALGQLAYLEVLDLRNNQLTTIPQSLAALPNRTGLY